MYLTIKKYFKAFFFAKDDRLFYDKPLSNQFAKFLKNLPIFFIIIFLTWTLLDLSQLKKITAEEIGKKNLLSKITQNPENFETYEEIVEGPINNIESEKLSYLEGEAISRPNTNITKNLADNFTLIGLEDSVLVPPVGSGSESVKTRTEIVKYQVGDGDTISSIAQKFGVTINTVLWANNLSFTSLIKPGQTLSILPISGINHKIIRGDTLSSLAKKYQTDSEKILEFNKLASASDIRVGETLIIPNGTMPAVIVTPARNSLKNIFIPPATPRSNTRFQWPLISRYITQYFGWRHSGLDIGDKTGNPIYAAENGRVETAGWNRGGYGNYIIINHGNGVKTLYGHASKIFVSAGDTVSRGQVIGLVGSTGRSTGSHLHFEVIVSGGKKNPLSYIR